MSKAELTAGEIAGRLPIGQARALLALSEHPQDMRIGWSAKWGYALERRGLAKRTLLSDRTYLTPLGLAVRAILQDKDHQS